MAWRDWWQTLQKARNNVAGQLEAPQQAPQPTQAPILPPSEEVLTRVQQEPPMVHETKGKPRAHEIDPLNPWALQQVQSQGDTHPGTQGMSMAQMRMIARVPLVDAIINTRVAQIAAHGVPQNNPFDVGYRIQLRDPRQRSSEAAQRRATEIGRWLFTCGDPRVKEFNTFENHLKAGAYDSFVYDQYCAEILPGLQGKPAAVLAVDAATIRRATPTATEKEKGRFAPPAKGTRYVQVLNQKVTAEWTADEFIFGVRNPRSTLDANGYGYPELERAVIVIGDLCNAMVYNARNFTNGTHAAGVMAIQSAMSKEMFDAWSTQLRAMMTGVHNAHRILTLKLDPELKEAMNFTSLNNNNRDMEYSNWVSFLLKVVAAEFQMDPAELGFVYGNEGQSGALSQAGPGERIQSSKERGLRPAIRAFQTWWNYKVIYQIDPDFELVLAGFDKATELLKQELLGKVVRTHWTVNEVRAIDDLPPLPTPAAVVGPSDGVFMGSVQYWQQQQQEQLQQQQQVQAQEQAMAQGDVLGDGQGVEVPPDQVLPDEQAAGDMASQEPPPEPDFEQDALNAMFEQQDEPSNGAVKKSIRFHLN